MTRIIAGAARGRRLKTPHGTATRPTSDRVREALFSALESELGTLVGTRFLDLFAGSGAVGLEAKSRGADEVVLVEHDRSTAAMIRSNAAELGFDGVTVLPTKVERLAAGLSRGPFDVVYVDPPYTTEKAVVFDTIATLRETGWFSQAALVVVERPRRDGTWMWPMGLEGVREKKYGETMLWYGRAVHRAADPDDAV